MKNCIATTTLLLAATALANASTPTAINWTDLTTTLTYNNTSDAGNTDHGIDAGRAGFGTIKNGDTSYTTIDSSKFDWQVSFQVDTLNNANELMVFSTSGGGDGSGYEIVVKGTDSSTSSYTAALFYSASGTGSRSDYLAGVECGTDADCDSTNKKTLSNCETGNSPATVALTWIANEKRLYLSVETGEGTAGSTNSTKWIAYDTQTTSSGSNLTLTTCSNITDNSPTGTIFWSNGNTSNGNELQNIKLRIHAIDAVPEPSAFGLLAGLGAIALAVSRRKRRSGR